MKTRTPIKFARPTAEKRRLLEEILSKPGYSRTCERLMRILIGEGELGEATKVYSLFRCKKGARGKTGKMLAAALAAAGDTARAVRVFKDLIRRFPRDYSNYKDLEKIYLLLGKPGRAIALYKGIGPTHPLRRKSFKRLTGIYNLQGDLPRAIHYLKKEIKEFGPSAKRCKELGKLYLAHKEYLKASQSFQNALALDRDDRRLRVWLGVALMENDNFKLAEYEFSQMLAERPHGFGELIHMAELRLRENRIRDARLFLEQVEKYHPGSSRATLCRAEIAFLEGRYRESVRLGEKALAQTPFYYTWEQMRCHRILKHAYHALKRAKKSSLHREMQEALGKSRDVFSGLIGIAELKNRNGKPEEGRSILEHIIELYPGSARARVALAEAHMLKAQERKAAKIAEAVVRETPARYTVERARAHSVLAKAYRRMGKGEKAAHHRRLRAALKTAAG